MKLWVVANPKGGSGKSTLATNLAGYLALQGEAVMLGDIDRQQSSREWLMRRPFALPSIDAWEIGADGVSRPPKHCTHVVLDTPAGLRGKTLSRLLKVATRIVVPVQPSVFDMQATRHFLDALLQEKAVRKSRVDVAIVGMRVDARTRSATELERFLGEYDFPVLTYLRDTQNYVAAAAGGLSIFDLPAGRTSVDREQWAPLIRWMGG